jgi:ATP/maltotriose-dependent transcriptional regulator MalT
LLGERHEKLALIYNQLAQTRYQLGDSLDAVRWTRASLAIFQAVTPKHANTFTLTANLARYLGETGKPAEAESLARRVTAWLDSTKSTDRGQAISMKRVLGAALSSQGKDAEALPLLSRALAESRAAFGDNNLRTAHVQMTYARALAANGRLADAAPLARSAHEFFKGQQKVQPRLYAQASALLAQVNAASR